MMGVFERANAKDPIKYDPADMPRRTEYEKFLRRLPDPSANRTGEANIIPKLDVKNVYAVFQADHRGLIEVLYRNNDDEVMTAWMRSPKELAYITEGW